jgi:hypothetical protein
MTDADLLATQVAAELPPASTWVMPPRGYRQALALCVIDGVTRQVAGDDTADALILDARSRLGDAADHAGLDELPDALVDDGSAAFELVMRAAAVLTVAGISSTSDLVDRLKVEGLDGELGTAWASTDGLTRRMWADTAMLSGYLDPEVDRVISGYVSRALGSDPATTPVDRVIAALTEVAERYDSKILPLEFAILRFERA